MPRRFTRPELTDPLLDEELYSTDPFQHYRQLRRDAPVVWHPEPGFWVVSRYADVLEISRKPELFCSGRGVLLFEIGVEYPSPPTMMHTDPPEHTQYRKLVQPAFRPSRIDRLGQAVRLRARSLLEGVRSGEVLEFVDRIAVPYPLMIISDFLGIPPEDWPRFFEWSEASIPDATDWSEQKKEQLRIEMQEYLLSMAAQRRSNPRADLISDIATSRVDGRALADEEIVMFLIQLLVAGNETTRNLLSGGLMALAENPVQWGHLVTDPSLVPSAVEEMLRWTTPVIGFMRTATCETQLGGQVISEGDPVYMLYASANRDESEFGATAGRFDVTRNPNHHLSFGFGAHFCIGAALARLEAGIMLEEILARFESVEPAGPAESTRSSIIAGLKSAPLCFA